MPVLVTGYGVEQLLGVPELTSDSGLSAATAVVQQLTEWDIVHHIIGMVFDTTAHNSGRVKGACTLIQQQLDKELLELACRHHIFELVLGVVFETLVGISKTPTIPFVDLLAKEWKNLDQGIKNA
jgi:hypothetical protein